MKVILDQAKLNEIQSLLNDFPIKHIQIVESIVKILSSAIEQETELSAEKE